MSNSLHRKLNTSPASLDEAATLAKPLCLPKVKKIDLHFPFGLEVTARNLKGVTIKDALDAIHKQFKKKVCPPISFNLFIPYRTDFDTSRPTTNLRTLTLLGSSGTRRNATRAS